MTTNFHTAFPFGGGITAAGIEYPMGQLDAAISAAMTSGSGWTSSLDGTAAAGQKVVPVTSTVVGIGAQPGMAVWIGEAGGTTEVRVIDTVQAGVSVTLLTNLTNTYAAGVLITASPAELVDARGGAATLGARLAAYSSVIPKVVAIAIGTTTYTPSSGVRAIYVECIGGGGGGGGVATAATNAGAGGGGGGGAYSAIWILTPASSYAVAVGAGGAGGTAGANAGTAGGDTTFGSPSVCTAKGGGGGQPDTVAAGPRVAGRGYIGGLASGGVGDARATGGQGGAGLVLAAAQAIAGHGGTAAGWASGGGYARSSSTGGGGQGTGDGTYYGVGGGGGGGLILSGGASVAGEIGRAGLIRVTEF